jgi:hypothetical protein
MGRITGILIAVVMGTSGSRYTEFDPSNIYSVPDRFPFLTSDGSRPFAPDSGGFTHVFQIVAYRFCQFTCLAFNVPGSSFGSFPRAHYLTSEPATHFCTGRGRSQPAHRRTHHTSDQNTGNNLASASFLVTVVAFSFHPFSP